MSFAVMHRAGGGEHLFSDEFGDGGVGGEWLAGRGDGGLN